MVKLNAVVQGLEAVMKKKFDEEKEEEKIAKTLNEENEVAVIVEHASLSVNGEKVIEETSVTKE